MSNLGKRVASAVVMVPVVVAAVIWSEPWLWGFAVGLVAESAAREIGRLAIASGIEVSIRIASVASFAMAWVVVAPPSLPISGSDAQVGVAIVLVIAAFLEQLRRRPEARSVAGWGLTVAVPAYVGGMASFAIRLRAIDDGTAWVLILLVLIWLNDSAAYFGGRAFGRHPMAPALSPKKTWEGLAVGSTITVVVALGLAWYAAVNAPFRWVPSDLTAAPMWVVAALGLAVSIAGPLGDLSHSFIKRQFGAKDSSNVIPGHGGVWDRIDSLLFAAPVVYLFARLLGG